MRTTFSLAALAAVAPLAFAQTYTSCNPMKNASCPTDQGLNQKTWTYDFSNGLPKDWTATSGSIDTTSNGGRFRISKIGDGPTVQSNWYFFYGRVDVTMQAAPGQGIISSVVLESDDLDEVDWEFVGSDTARGQTNYFGKGNTTTYDRGGFSAVSNPESTFHTYSFDWKPASITWLIDNNVVRTLNYADANGGANFPQTPMTLRMGNWIGGAPGNAAGTIEWAGGLVDISKAPFDMLVKTVTVTNYNPAASYKYGDMTGSSASIQIQNGSSSGSSSGSNSSSGSSSGSSTQSGSSTGTTLVASPTGSSNGTTATGKAQTPSGTTTGSSSKVSATATATGNAAASNFQTSSVVLGSSLLSVLGLFLTL